MSPSEDITALLIEWQQGAPDAEKRLYARVYEALREIAHRQLRRRRPGQTVNTTALVHEVYLKLVDQTQAQWQDRVHFFAIAATAMKHILINYAEKKGARKRGGGWQRIHFDEAGLAPEERAEVLLALDEALQHLAALDARLSRVVELRFFGGMTEEEIAHVLGVSERTVRRDWRQAKAFLAQALAAYAPPNEHR